MKFEKRPVVLITVISLLLFFSAISLQAADITIKPKIATSWKTDSNFFKTETNERRVDTYLVQPGIDLGFETPKTEVLLNYTFNARYYDDRDTVPSGQRKADDDDYVGHTVAFNSRYRAFDRLLIGLDDSYHKTRDPANADRFSNTTDRDKFEINRLTPSLFYDFGEKFTAGLRYRNTIMDYSKDREDSTEDRGMFDLIYNFTRKTSLDLEYQHWKMDYDKTTSNYTSDQIQLIFRKEFNYVTIKAGGGYHERDFDDPTLNNIDTLAYTISVRPQYPPASADVDTKSYLQFSAELNLNDQGVGDSYYKAHRFSVDAGHIFLEKLKVAIGGYYQNSDYERATGLTPEGTIERREDDLYFISGSIGYVFADYLTFSVSASYEDRDSNLSGFDYDNKSLMATLDFGYDIGRR